MSQIVRGELRRTATGWVFAAPYVLLLVAFGLIPAGYALSESLHTLAKPGSLSLGNWELIVNDFRFWPAVQNVGIFMIIWIPIMVVGTMLLALLLHEKVGRLSGAMRLIYFLPGAVTGSAAVLLWYFMLSPQLSPFAPGAHAGAQRERVQPSRRPRAATRSMSRSPQPWPQSLRRLPPRREIGRALSS